MLGQWRTSIYVQAPGSICLHIVDNVTAFTGEIVGTKGEVHLFMMSKVIFLLSAIEVDTVLLF